MIMKIKLIISFILFICIVSCSTLPHKCSDNNIYLISSGSKEIRFGYTDKFGKTLIPSKYEDARQFSEGLAAVKLNRKWGFIDANDSIVIPLAYGWASSFGEYGFEGLSIVKIDNNFERGVGITSLGKTGLINKAGEVILPLSYVYIAPIVNGLTLINDGSAAIEETDSYNGKYGFINSEGKIVVPCLYDRAEPFLSKISLVKKNGKWGGLNLHGKEVIQCVYDTLQRDKVDCHIIIGTIASNSVLMDLNGKIVSQ